MQHFSVSDLTAKMTRTQKSQKLCKTMLHSLFFFLHHICLYGSPVSHCLLCSVIIIGVAILSTLNYFSLFLKEKLRDKNGILLHLLPPCWSTDPLTQCLCCPNFHHHHFTQTERQAKYGCDLFIHSTNTWNPIRYQELRHTQIWTRSVPPLTAWQRGILKK